MDFVEKVFEARPLWAYQGELFLEFQNAWHVEGTSHGGFRAVGYPMIVPFQHTLPGVIWQLQGHRACPTDGILRPSNLKAVFAVTVHGIFHFDVRIFQDLRLSSNVVEISNLFLALSVRPQNGRYK
jgi:hypothetical protein